MHSLYIELWPKFIAGQSFECKLNEKCEQNANIFFQTLDEWYLAIQLKSRSIAFNLVESCMHGIDSDIHQQRNWWFGWAGLWANREVPVTENVNIITWLLDFK